MEIYVDSFPREYGRVLRAVRRQGDWAAPRGEGTREVLGVTIVLRDTRCVLPVGTGRGVKPSLAETEALELIAGTHDPDNQRFDPGSGFVNDPNLECYGPLTLDAIERSVRFLQEDRSSRRAVANLGHTGGDSPYPCLASLGWVIRRDQLVAFADFRSNDAWLGLPYDIHAVASLQRSMANVLGVIPGTVFYHARSLHLYERHLGLVDRVEPDPDTWRPTTEVGGADWASARAEAAQRLAGMRAREIGRETGAVPEPGSS